MEARVIVVRNFKSRIERLHTSVRCSSNSAGCLQYRLENLCRDILQYREHFSTHDYDVISDNVLSAKRIVDQVANEADDASSHGPPPATGSGVGRPKYIITEEQLRFFLGKNLIFFLRLWHT